MDGRLDPDGGRCCRTRIDNTARIPVIIQTSPGWPAFAGHDTVRADIQGRGWKTSIVIFDAPCIQSQAANNRTASSPKSRMTGGNYIVRD